MPLDFDGVNDKVEFGDIGAIDNATNITIAFWIKQDTWTSVDGIMTKGGSVLRIIQFAASAQIDFQGTAGGAEARSATGDFPTGTWHHYCAVFNGAGVGNSGR